MQQSEEVSTHTASERNKKILITHWHNGSEEDDIS